MARSATMLLPLLWIKGLPEPDRPAINASTAPRWSLLAALTTASAARASACNSAASSSDPTTASTPHAATASAFAWLRTRPRTVWPSAIRADATAPPIKPLAPVTKICILALPRFSRDENVAANSSPLHVAKPNTETTRRVLRPKSPTASPTAGPTAPNRMRRSPTTRPEQEWPTRPFMTGAVLRHAKIEKATNSMREVALQRQLNSMIVTSGNPSRKNLYIVRVEGHQVGAISGGKLAEHVLETKKGCRMR